MVTDTVVRARINGRIKDEATHVLEEMGLSVSDAIRLLLIRVAREKPCPSISRIQRGNRRGDRRSTPGKRQKI